MKPAFITASSALFVFVLASAGILLTSWDHKPAPRFQNVDHKRTDTVPKKERKVRDLDDAVAELDAVNIDLEIEKAMAEVQKSLKELDLEKINLDIQKSLASTDMKKAKVEMEKALKEIDFQKMQLDIQQNLKEIDFAEMEKDIKSSLAKIDFDKMQADFDAMKKIDLSRMEKELAKTKVELEKMGPKLEAEMQKAKSELKKAKEELKEYKAFVDGLEKDGLIEKDKNYSIEHKDGKLIINGKEASKSIYDKNKSFLEKHEKFEIEKNEDDFDIDMQ